MVDAFTKWVEAVPVVHANAQETAQAFIEGVLCRHGVPKEVVSDQGSHFLNELMTSLSELLPYQHMFTTAYRPQANGQVERLNQVVKEGLRRFGSRAKWDVLLPLVVWAANTSIHPATGESPFFLNYGRDPYMPVDVLFNTQLHCLDPSDYRRNLLINLKDAFNFVENKWKKYNAQSVEYWEKHHHQSQQFQIGERVWLWSFGRTQKPDHQFQPRWVGPYRIQSIATEDVYWLEGDARKTRRAHASQLKRYLSREVPSVIPDDIPSAVPNSDNEPEPVLEISQNLARPPLVDGHWEDKHHHEFALADILGVRKNDKRQLEFKVKDERDGVTWLSKSRLTMMKCESKMKEFWGKAKTTETAFILKRNVEELLIA